MRIGEYSLDCDVALQVSGSEVAFSVFGSADEACGGPVDVLDGPVEDVVEVHKEAVDEGMLVKTVVSGVFNGEHRPRASEHREELEIRGKLLDMERIEVLLNVDDKTMGIGVEQVEETKFVELAEIMELVGYVLVLLLRSLEGSFIGASF